MSMSLTLGKKRGGGSGGKKGNMTMSIPDEDMCPDQETVAPTIAPTVASVQLKSKDVVCLRTFLSQ